MKLALFISGVFWVICWTLWHICGADLWYIGNAQFIFACVAYIHYNTQEIKKRFVSRVFLFIAFNSLFDELFGDPQKIGYVEYAVSITYILYQTYKWIKYSKSRNY